ncbi:M24 family metallopeptidase [Mycobacterium asiaticum]|uniref:Xaa-Pro aminopeptidase n=1 Tax=Mycobacterium asiaticum TaxID=1790 RepID=A0A1A3NII8_MYCAS|nr:M24 family metallopeptidase [Mycobacterium asiaticum]OBK21968.1 Xaa-Pro aminopeptidase [Mycobacterium asiaticum]
MTTDVSSDPRPLRIARRERALAQMAADHLDVLVLGRQANIRYVTGAPQLWIAGTRPFGPMCVVVRDTGEIYLNATDDEGVPEEIDHDHFYGLAWNPMTLIEVIRGIDGAATARRVGTDALTPTFAALLPQAFPLAEIVDGENTMRAARRIKTPDEIGALGTALRVAERGLAAGVGELRPGASVQTLTGAVLEAMAAGGVSTPATQDAAWVTPRDRPSGAGRPVVCDGDLVAFAAGALAGGYVAEVGRTWPAGESAGGAVRRLYARLNTVYDKLIDACRPGAPAERLLAAYAAAGEPLPPMAVAHGLGLGFDPPVISGTLPAAGGECLETGMVLAVTGYVWQHGVGGALRRDTIHVAEHGPEVLTASPSWAAGQATAPASPSASSSRSPTR